MWTFLKTGTAETGRPVGGKIPSREVQRRFPKRRNKTAAMSFSKPRNKREVPNQNESQDHIGVQRLQAEKLRHDKEQEERPRQT